MSGCPHCGCPHGTGQLYDGCPSRDARAIAYYTGAADKRYGRPRRVDLADRDVIGDAYHRGYDATETRAVAS